MQRFDERHNVQARNTLQPGSAEYEEFYRQHPEWQVKDDAIRALPGMGNVGPAADRGMVGAQIQVIAALGMSHLVDGPVAPERVELTPERATEKVKGFAKHLGADMVAVGPLNPDYVYTNVGKDWHDPERSFGQPIAVPHKNAISLAVGLSPRHAADRPGHCRGGRDHAGLHASGGHGGEPGRVHPLAGLPGAGERHVELPGALGADRHRSGHGRVGAAWPDDHQGTGQRAQARHRHHRSAPRARPRPRHRCGRVLRGLQAVRRDLPERRHQPGPAQDRERGGALDDQSRGLLHRVERDRHRLRSVSGELSVEPREERLPPPDGRDRHPQAQGGLVDEPGPEAVLRTFQAEARRRAWLDRDDAAWKKYRRLG